MTDSFRARALALFLIVVSCPAGAVPAGAQELTPGPPTADQEPPAPPARPPRPPLLKPFTGLIGDLKRVPTANNLDWLVVGLGAAAIAHHADAHITRTFPLADRQPFQPGAIVGATPLGLSAAFATYAIGRSTDSPRAMALGSDLIRAQLLAEVITIGVKQMVRRSRPEGSGYSFPSGHTGVTFASATVLQRHFGWKVGAPAYAVAAYVAASRVQMKRHYLSDVAFGAAVGFVAGRTVTVGRGTTLTLTPIAASGGGGIGFAWAGKPQPPS
jgi:membrane-associated phospholipid phosphatase